MFDIFTFNVKRKGLYQYWYEVTPVLSHWCTELVTSIKGLSEAGADHTKRTWICLWPLICDYDNRVKPEVAWKFAIKYLRGFLTRYLYFSVSRVACEF